MERTKEQELFQLVEQATITLDELLLLAKQAIITLDELASTAKFVNSVLCYDPAMAGMGLGVMFSVAETSYDRFNARLIEALPLNARLTYFELVKPIG